MKIYSTLIIISLLNAECINYFNWRSSPTFKIDKEHCDYFSVDKFLNMECCDLGNCSQSAMNSMWNLQTECEAFIQKNNTQSETVVYDYVSSYDWSNVSLSDLPWQIATWQIGGSQYFSYINHLEEIEFSGSLLDMQIFWLEGPLCYDYPDCYENSENSSFIPFKGYIDMEECSAKPHRHRNQTQILSGAVTISNSDDLRCQECTNGRDKFGNFLENCFYYIIYTDDIVYGDVNFDGYMDVFLGIVNVGHGSAQVGYRIAYLTKTDPNQKTFTMIKPLKHQTDNKNSDD